MQSAEHESPECRAKWRATGLLTLACAALALSCDGGGGEKPRPQSTVFTERRPLTAATPSLQLGQDCSGGSGCLSGICYKTGPGYGAGYICSKRCDSAADCPRSGWTCSAMLPGPGASFCVPTRNGGGGAPPGPVPPSRDGGAP